MSHSTEISSKEIGFFSSAHDFMVTNSTMIAHFGENKSIELLVEHIILGAEYDSSERDPPPNCHPGTRTEISEKLKNWLHNAERKHRILWLHGPAGVGKSALLQSMAEVESDSLESILGATIFFSRPNRRSDPKRVFTTIAYQLAVRFQPYRKYITDILTNDPRIVGKSVAEQFKWFIVKPFVTHDVLRGHRSTVLIILDGLDECEGEEAQRELVLLIGRFSLKHPTVPLVWAIASRPEPHLQTAFSNAQINGCHWAVTISANSAEARADVERFLRDKFREIRERYPSFFLSGGTPWPSEADFRRVVAAASGLFIYASVIVRFILDESFGNPISQLESILRAISSQPSSGSSENPLSTLDCLYQEILSSISPAVLPTTKLLLALSFQRKNAHNQPFWVICNWLKLSQADAYGALRKLHSVIQIPQPPTMSIYSRLAPFHTSFTDYILSPRSGQFYYTDDPLKVAVSAAVRVLCESRSPEGTITASRVKLSWAYAGQIYVMPQLLRMSVWTVWSNIHTALSCIKDPESTAGSDQIHAFFQDLDYGKPYEVGIQHFGYIFSSPATNLSMPMLDTLRKWDLLREVDLQSVSIDRVRPDGVCFALPAVSYPRPATNWDHVPRFFEALPAFLKPRPGLSLTPVERPPDWRELVGKHLDTMKALKPPARAYLIGRGDKSLLYIFQNEKVPPVFTWNYHLPYDKS